MKLRHFILLLSMAIGLNVWGLGESKDSLLRIIRNSKNPEALLTAFPSLAYSLHLSNPDSAILMANRGIALADSLGNMFHKGSSMNMSGLAHYRKGWYSKAISMFEGAERIFIQLAAFDQLARVHQNMSHVFQARRDYRKAQVYSLQALRFYEDSRDSIRIGALYQTLSILNRELRNYKASVRYIDESIRILSSFKAWDELGNAYSIKGNLFAAMNRDNEALKEFDRALPLYDLAGDKANKAITFENMAHSWEVLGNQTKAVQYYRQSQALFRDAIGSDVDVAYEQMRMSKPLWKMGYFAEAGKALDSAERVFLAQKLPDYLSELYDYRSGFADARGNAAEALDYYRKHIGLRDSLNESQQREQSARTLAEFESERKEQQIQLLRAKSEAGESGILRRNLIITLLVLLGLASLIVFLIARNRRRLQDALQKQQLLNRIASDLHDDVGASLSAIRMYSDVIRKKADPKESETAVIAGKISENAREVIQNMSDIVWTIKPGLHQLKDLEDRIHYLGIELCRPLDVQFVFDGSGRAYTIGSVELRNDLYLIAKEALNNALKYSGTSKIALRISIAHSSLQLEISDWGKGFRRETTHGNGLRNMESRCRNHDGQFHLDTEIGKGTRIRVTIPL
jgi:signal transduction histidine kinase